MKKLLLAIFLTLFGSTAHAACTAGTLPFTLQNNTTADATQVMANFNQITSSVAANCASSGANSDITALTGLTTPLGYTSGGSSVYIGGTSTGTANAQAIASPTPIGFSLTAGKQICFIAGATNTGATTFNINSTGATAVNKNGHGGLEALTGGEIVSGNTSCAWYNGTVYVLTVMPFFDIATLTNLASATTTDLGTIPTHNVNITGTTTITGFGSTATTTEPVYYLKFAGALTLTYNATSLILPGIANITTAANDTAVAMYLGSGNWQIISYTRAAGTAVVNPTPLCGATGFTFFNNAGTPNTNFDYAASQAVLINPTGNVPIYGTSISGTINTTTGTVTSAADGMDGEARPTSAWGYAYLISDGTNFKGLMSTSATAPTMPSSYVYRCLLAAMPFDGSQNAYRVRQAGSGARYTLVNGTNTANSVSIITGASGNPANASITWTPVQVTGNAKCAPSIATNVRVMGWVQAGSGTTPATIFAPNNSYAGYDQSTVGAPHPYIVPMNNVAAATNYSTLSVDILLESVNIYYAANSAAAGLFCEGYRLPVNAN